MECPGQGHEKVRHRRVLLQLQMALSLALTLALAQIFANLSRPKSRNAE